MPLCCCSPPKLTRTLGTISARVPGRPVDIEHSTTVCRWMPARADLILGMVVVDVNGVGSTVVKSCCFVLV